jgi:hypothetical protein
MRGVGVICAAVLIMLIILYVICNNVFGSDNDIIAVSGSYLPPIVGGVSFASGTLKSSNVKQTKTDTCKTKKQVSKPQNVLIVDVANMYIGWYMETYNKSPPYMNQVQLMDSYRRCMSDHYSNFIRSNSISTAGVVYVIKNYKFNSGKRPTADRVTADTWKMFTEFVEFRPNVTIAVAEDYNTYPTTKWKDPKFHYLRGRDDYTCFYTAQMYKKKFTPTYVMTNDKFKDFEHFGKVPKFDITYLTTDSKRVVNVSPRPNILGQFRDYKVVGINLDFDMKKPLTKHDVKPAGSVWGSQSYK